MPHQCVRCGKFYDDGANTLLKGCVCGSNFFFFVRKEHMDKAREVTVKLDNTQKMQIEKDVKELIGAEVIDRPVVLDLESIRILKPGQYEISLVDIFNKKPLIYRLEEGKYVIDLAETFDSLNEDKK